MDTEDKMHLAYIYNPKEQYCAFCKFWDDDENTEISPLNLIVGAWLFDEQANHLCKIKCKKTQGCFTCDYYECKIEYGKSYK